MDRQSHHIHRPAYPSLADDSFRSAFRSSSSLSSLSSQGSAMSPVSPTTPSRRSQTSAPLPSPTGHPPQYFGSLGSPQQQSPAQSQAQWQAQHQQQQQQQYAQQYQQYQQQQYALYQQQQAPTQQPQSRQQSYTSHPGYAVQPTASSTAATTVPQDAARYMGSYNLVAEAAKRAQMAVLMRDMEGIDLR